MFKNIKPIMQERRSEMKKVCFILLFTLTIATACQSSTLHFSELSTIPSEVQQKIDSSYTVQLINDGGEIYYIIYHSKELVTAEIEAEGERIKVQIEEAEQQNDEGIKQYVYKLTLDPEHDIIEAFINGESTPFDQVTVY